MYRIHFSEKDHIVHVIYQGRVSLDERIEAVNQVCSNYAYLRPLRALVNVLELEMCLTPQEQKAFGEFLALHPLLANAKVAVLHKPDYNPNLLIDAVAFNNGYRLAEFNQANEAESWLLQP